MPRSAATPGTLTQTAKGLVAGARDTPNSHARGRAPSQLCKPNRALRPSCERRTSKRVMVNSEARRSHVPSSSVELHAHPDTQVTFAVPMPS